MGSHPHTGEKVPPGGDGRVVLVVDDEVLIRMTVTEELSDEGYVCLEAGNGADALMVLREHPEIDILVTDVGLPGGLNGRQVAEAARVMRPGLPILFITGYADQATMAEASRASRTGVLTKPFRIPDLLEKVRTLLLQPAGG